MSICKYTARMTRVTQLFAWTRSPCSCSRMRERATQKGRFLYSRRRIHPKRNMQYLPVYRAPRRVPLCYGFGASYEGKLGQTDEAHSRQRLSVSRKDYNGVWQSEYARQKFILRSVSTGWGTETCQTFWVPSYTQAWQLTWHRRDRAGRADEAVPWQATDW